MKKVLFILLVFCAVSASAQTITFHPYQLYIGTFNPAEKDFDYRKDQDLYSGTIVFVDNELHFKNLHGSSLVLSHPLNGLQKETDEYTMLYYPMFDSKGAKVGVRFVFYKTGMTEIYLFYNNQAFCYKCRYTRD